MIRENDYLYASSFVRASERGGSARERLEKILSSANAEMLRKNAAEIFGVEESGNLENILSEALKRCIYNVTYSVPDPSVYAPLLYKYDCNNIKTALKCSLLSIDARGMLSPVGTIPAEKVIKCAESGDFKPLNCRMGDAARAAKEAYLKTGEAKCIDLIVDRACFEDMKATAEEKGFDLIIELVSATADKVNILTYLRTKAMDMPEDSAKSLIQRALVSGGNIPLPAFFGDIEHLKTNLDNCIFKKAFAEIAASSKNISVCERILDEAVLSLVSDVKFKAFGPQVPLRYLLVCEAEIMNCRIMARSLAEGIGLGEIREGMRWSYV